MSLSIVSTPKVIVEGQESRWNGAFERFIFDLFRKDFQIQMVFSNLGQIATVITPPGPPLLPLLTPGEFVFLSNPTWTGNFEIDSILAPNMFRVLTPQGNLFGVANGGYLNLIDTFKNYRVQIRVLLLNEANMYEQFGLAEYRSDAIGQIRVDLQEFAQVLTLQENDFQYDAINERDAGLGTRINLQFRELFLGSTNEFQVPVNAENLHFFTNEARQIGDRNGNNVAERVPFDFDVAEVNKAKFCHPDVKLTFWPGFPFDLTFIFSEQISNLVIERVEETFDLNGVANVPLSIDDLLGGSSFVNRLTLTESYIEGTDEEVDVWLNNTGDVPVAEQWGEPGYAPPDYAAGTGVGLPENPGDFVPSPG